MAFTPGQVLTAAQMNALEGATLPSGAITMYGAATAPTGYLLCDGTAVSRTTYAALFTAISTTYGAGNGSTTFNLPNLKGRVPVGLDSSQTEFDVRGETGGAKTHTLTTSEMPVHTHIQDAHTHTQNAHTHIQDAHTHTQASHNHTYQFQNTTANNGSGVPIMNGDGAANTSSVAPTINSTTATNQNTTAVNQNTTATNQNAGSGAAHNNLQPYLVLNFIIKT